MNFDLDIHNYNKSDLEDLLDLKYPYVADDVNSKCTIFQESVNNNSTLDNNFTKNITVFLNAVKIKLIGNSQSSDLLSHKSFENPRLPTSKVLQVGNTQIIEQNARNSILAINPSTTSLSSNLTYNLAADEAPGKMNPLYKRTVTKCLTIDSRFRDNYYNNSSSDFMINLPMKFSDVIQLQLSEIELPLTFYAISQQLGNNYFWIRMKYNTLINDTKWMKDEDSSYYTMIEIPDGNYIHKDLTIYLNQVLNSLFKLPTSILSDTIVQPLKVVIDINTGGSGSGRTIFSGTGNIGTENSEAQIDDLVTADKLIFELNFSCPYYKDFQKLAAVTTNPTTNVKEIYDTVDTTPLPLKFGWILGYRNTKYTSFNKLENPDEDVKGSTYVSEGFFECHGPRYLFLVVDDYNNNVTNNMFSAFNSSILSKNILARISVKGTVFSILSDDAKHITSNTREYFGPVNIEKMRIQLLDEYGRIIDMNNMDFSMALNIKSVYDS